MSNATVVQAHVGSGTLAAPTAKRGQHYPALDGLRGIAILAVFLSHYSGGHTSGNAAAHLVAAILDAGWVGVDLFFVLSGFLITGILLDTQDRPHKVRNFYARRALRIFPVFYGVLCTFLLLTPILHLHWRAQHLLYFLYLSNMNQLLVPQIIPPGRGVDLVHLWSLAVEEQFYLIWPVIVWGVRDRRLLLRIGVFIMVGAFLLRVLMVFKGVDSSVIYQLLPTRADSLVCGGILALLVRSEGAKPFQSNTPLIASGLGVLLIFWSSRSGQHHSAMISTVGYSLLALFFAGIVCRAQEDGHWVQAVSSLRIFRFFGRYSYGLYIYHGVLLVFLIPWLGPIQSALRSPFGGGVLFTLLCFGVSLAIAMLSFHFIEEPILRQKRRFA